MDSDINSKEFEFACSGTFGLGTHTSIGKIIVTIEVDGKGNLAKSFDSEDEANGYIQNAIRTAYEGGIEKSTKISVNRTDVVDTVWFDGRVLTGYRIRDCMEPEVSAPALQLAEVQKAAESSPSMPEPQPRKSETYYEQWNRAVAWARRKGVSLRNGKVSSAMLRVKVHDAGLTDEWNAAWPQFAFDEEGYIWAAKEIEKARIRRLSASA